MRLLSYFILFLTLFFTPLHLFSDPIYCTSNDTLTSSEDDPYQLFKFLVGTWSVQGTWQVTEGQGKVRYTARAALSGTETYKLVLNGHFLQRSLNTKISYYSRDYGKKMTNNYSAETFYTYNQNASRFLMWSFDCSGSHLNAKGFYDSEDKEYQFTSVLVSEKGDEIETLHKIIYVDQDQFRWEVLQKTKDDYEWQLAASGTAQRKKKR